MDNKPLKFGRCGICNINFKSNKERNLHFDSLKHAKNLANPELMHKALMKSQLSILPAAKNSHNNKNAKKKNQNPKT